MPDDSKRTRHLELRCKLLSERVDEELADMAHLQASAELVADARIAGAKTPSADTRDLIAIDQSREECTKARARTQKKVDQSSGEYGTTWNGRTLQSMK